MKTILIFSVRMALAICWFPFMAAALRTQAQQVTIHIQAYIETDYGDPERTGPSQLILNFNGQQYTASGDGLSPIFTVRGELENTYPFSWTMTNNGFVFGTYVRFWISNSCQTLVVSSSPDLYDYGDNNSFTDLEDPPGYGHTFTDSIVVHTNLGEIIFDACNDTLLANGKDSTKAWVTRALHPPLRWSQSPSAMVDILTNAYDKGISALVTAKTRPGTVTITVTDTNGCSISKDLHLEDPESGCSPCSGSNQGGENGGPPILGKGSPMLSGMNQIGLKLSLGSEIGGGSAHSLLLPLTTAGALAYQPADLKLPWSSTDIDVIWQDGGGGFDDYMRQIRVPQGLVNVTTGDSSDPYYVHFYANTNVGLRATNNYIISGAPLVTWKIHDRSAAGPGTNGLKITEIRTNETDRVYSLAYLNPGWALTNADGTIQTFVPAVPANDVRTEAFAVYSTSSTLIQTNWKQFTTNNGFERLTLEIRGSGVDARTNSYAWYTNGLMQQMIREDGYWEYYVYDDKLRPTNIFGAFGNQSITNNAALCRLIEHSYDTNVVNTGTLSGDDGVNNPASPRRTIEYLLGNSPANEVSRRYQVFLDNEMRDIRCISTNAAWNDGNNLVTIHKSYTSGFWFLKPFSVERPDGTVDLFQYTYGGNINNYTNTVWSGVPNAGRTAIIDGTKTVTITGPLGQLISVTTTDLTNNIVTAQQLYGAYDTYSRPQAVTNGLDGTWEFSQRSCCGDIISTNREGTVTTKTYDAMNRLLTTKMAGIIHSNTYDAAGRIIKVERIGSYLTNAAIVLQQNGYNTAGRMIGTTNALGRLTILGESFDGSGQRITTNIVNINSSIFGERRETYYRDGTLARVEGSLVHPVRYEYGPTNGGTFTKEIKLNANGTDTSEWTIQFHDTAARPYKLLYADTNFSQTFYNSKGQATNEVDPDGVSMLYQYDDHGDREYTVLDLDRNATIDFGGTDRITRNVHYVTNGANGPVRWSATYVWATNSENVGTLASVNESAVNGLTNWSARYGLTTRTETKYLGDGVRYARTIAPDDSFTTTRFENGQVIATARTNDTTQVSATTFGYDEHGRQTLITDARNGTTTNSFDNLDQIFSVSTPAPAAGQSPQVTSYSLDRLGRATEIHSTGINTVYKEYFDSGELKKINGGHNYPVEYSYDSQGRMLTMKTWQNYAGGAGTPATTTWNHDAYRGFMTNKVYDGGTAGPGYRYTPAGRLYQRTWARGITTTYNTNAAGEVASIDYSDSTPDVTYTHDRLGRQTTIVDGAGTHVLAYEPDGRLLVETNTAGILAGIGINSSYDALNRRSSLTLNPQLSALTTSYGYDGASRLIGVTNGVNTASYSYIANSPLVSQIEFKNSGTTRMTTTKSYDLLNRLTATTNLPSADLAVLCNYSNNNANQRVAITNIDGSRWVYTYDSLGQVTSGKKYWSDGTAVLGQEFDYTFDDIGNRKTAISGGDAYGKNKRYQNYTVNNLNQYTSRSVPGYLDVLGTATNTATVTVNNLSSSRKSDYYRSEVPVANSSSAVWQGITNVAVLAVGTNDMVTNAMGNLFVPQTPEAFGYDADGNMTNDGRWSLTWDAENRLTKAESLSTSPVAAKRKVIWDFDGHGRRVRQITYDGSSGSYVVIEDLKFVSDGWQHIAELNGTNDSLICSYIWGFRLGIQSVGAGSLLMKGSADTGVHCYGFDGEYHVVMLVSLTNGMVTAQYEYDPLGSVLRDTGALANENRYRASTKRTDATTRFELFELRPRRPDLSWLSRRTGNENEILNPYSVSGHRSAVFAPRFFPITMTSFSGSPIAAIARHAEPYARWVCGINFPVGSPNVIYNYNTNCTRGCTQAHEEQHSKDDGPCCDKARAEYQAASTQAEKDFVNNLWADWLLWNQAHDECKASKVGEACLLRMQKEWKCKHLCYQIFGSKERKKCCSDIDVQLTDEQLLIEDYCAKDPGFQVKCPFGL